MRVRFRPISLQKLLGFSILCVIGIWLIYNLPPFTNSNFSPKFRHREKRSIQEQKALPLDSPYSEQRSLDTYTNEHRISNKISMYNFTGPTNEYQTRIRDAFLHAWNNYKKYAWGHDELKPLSRQYHDWFGLGLTIIDSLDTMIIMNLDKEYLEARDWVFNDMSTSPDRDLNLFETTIRVLGGLLSAYHLTNDEIFLKRAADLGERLLGAFNSGSPVPYSDVNLSARKGRSPRWGPDSSTSEVSTIQIELKELSILTKDAKYGDLASATSRHIHTLEKMDGLVPYYINARTGAFRSGGTITLGARADSYYEYLLKQWIHTGKTENWLKEDYLTAMNGVQTHLVKRTPRDNLTFIGELVQGKTFIPKMDHLVCFLAGTLILGVIHGIGGSEHVKLAEELGHTCSQMYFRMPTGIAPEITHFNLHLDNKKDDIIVKPLDSHNLLRPETVESLFYLYRFTKDKKYRDWGWRMFLSWEKYAKLPTGYANLGNVRNPGNPQPRDKMESFFLGETLKYLYLLFEDDFDVLSLNGWVFNTEAHPLPIHDLQLTTSSQI